MHIAMISAENGALPGGKVGGLGDVIREAPRALADVGQTVSILSPSYGLFVNVDRDRFIAKIDVPFSGRVEQVSLFEVAAPQEYPGVTHYVLDHWLFAAGGIGKIYCSDHFGPYATDAHKFALFSISVCEAIQQNIIAIVDVLHCHDWHSSLVLLLRHCAPEYEALKQCRAVFSIHNLSLQGVRPLDGNDSSLEAWLPNLIYEREKVIDSNDSHCINFMRTGINFADTVHTVSPSYAKEIVLARDDQHGFIGGDGLEQDLQTVFAQGRLRGILNGCDYSGVTPTVKASHVWRLIDNSLSDWTKSIYNLSTSYYFALRRLIEWQRKRKQVSPTLVSIGRLSEQKLGLLMQKFGEHSALDEILVGISPGRLIILGNGENHFDEFLTRCMAQHKNLLYLCGYSEQLANTLYSFGDLFLMPSTYEPCGISQMLAMRAGTPCLAHATGGLKDTVIPGHNGFVFTGNTTAEQIEDMIRTIGEAIDCFRHNPTRWLQLCEGAKASRFEWRDSIEQYINLLYSVGSQSDSISKKSA